VFNKIEIQEHIMQANRKKLKAIDFTLSDIKRRVQNIKPKLIEFVAEVGTAEIDQILATLTNASDAVTNQLKKMPIKYVFTDIFFIKKAYATPVESLFLKGAIASRREDLKSWEVYFKDGKFFGMCRDIFFDEDMKLIIKNEDARAVFDT